MKTIISAKIEQAVKELLEAEAGRKDRTVSYLVNKRLCESFGIIPENERISEQSKNKNVKE